MRPLVTLRRAAPLALLVLATSGWGPDRDGDEGDRDAGGRLLALQATLRGWEETPAIVTNAKGSFRARVADDGSSIQYELAFSDLEGPVLFSHIHVGQRGVAGGVSAFLCGGGGKPACPPAGGTVAGIVSAGDVVGPAAQGVGSGQIDRLLRAIRAGAAYVNVHSTLHPGGEIRGQLKAAHGSDDPE
jgi:hypothetical protein